MNEYIPVIDVMELAIRSAFIREAAQGASLDLNEVVQSRVAAFSQYNPGNREKQNINYAFIINFLIFSKHNGFN